jgi:hypothetical protein
MTKQLLLNCIFFTLSHFASAQNNFSISKDSVSGQIIFQGIINEEILINEESFGWMRANLSSYLPDTIAVNLINKNKDSLHFLIFLGTWCEDSQQIIPKLFKLLHTAKFPSEKISLLGVDRKKKTSGYLSEALNVSRVPTILLMKNGKELDRIIEYGKYGNIDKDLIEILEINYNN